MFYYKQIDILDSVLALLTCTTRLNSTESQVEITEEEYNQLLAEMEVSEDE